MKKLTIISAILLAACGSDDSQTLNDENFLLGKWQLTAMQIVGGESLNVSDCPPTYEFLENGICNDAGYTENSAGECELHASYPIPYVYANGILDFEYPGAPGEDVDDYYVELSENTLILTNKYEEENVEIIAHTYNRIN